MNANMKPERAPFRRRRLTSVTLLALAMWAPLCPAGEAVEEGPTGRDEARDESAGVSRALPEGVPSLRMSTDYAQPGLGFGTYAPIGQVEARAIRVEPFNVRAAIQTAVGYDDNVTLSSTNKSGSMFTTVSPSVAVSLEGATQRYAVVYRGNYGVYASGAQDDYADHNLGVSAANDWATRFRTLVTYDLLKGHTPRGLTTTSQTAREQWTIQTLRGRADYGAVGAQAGVQGNVAYATRRFDSGVGNGFGEYDRLEGGGAFSYRVGPKTRASVQVQRASVEHPLDPTLDNTEMNYSVGVTWEALATMTGRFRVGYNTKDFTSALRPDFSGPGFEAAVTWTPRSFSVVDASLNRFLTESYEIGSSLVVNTVGRASWTHRWPRSIVSTVNYAYAQLEQEGLNRTDRLHTLATRVSYPFRRNLRVGAEIRHDTRDTPVAGTDYTRNILLLTLETAL